MKTLGFTNASILSIIIGEAATIAIIGGIAGVLLASVVTVFVGRFAELFNAQLHGLSVTPPVALLCIAVAFLIGVVSSFIPAFNASRTNILDSLRYAG